MISVSKKKKELTQAERIEKIFAPLESAVDSLWGRFAERSPTDEQPVSIQFAAGASGEGSTTVAACAAVGLARHLRVPVLLVQTTPGKVDLARLFGVEVGASPVSVLRGEASLKDSIVPTSVPMLSLIGTTRREKLTEISPAQLSQLLVELKKQFHYVIIDSPPLLDSAASRVLLRCVDKVVLVVRSGKTPRARAQMAVDVIHETRTEFVGCVVNRFRRDAPSWLVPSKWA